MNEKLTQDEAGRALLGVAVAQTAYALNNGGGIVVGQPLVYIDDKTTAGRPGHQPLNLAIPTGYVVEGIYKDNSAAGQNTGADMFVAFNPTTNHVLFGIAGTNGIGKDMPDTKADISYVGANQAEWLARNSELRTLLTKLGDTAGDIRNLHFDVGADSLSAVAGVILPTALISGLPGRNGQLPIEGIGIKASQFTITNVVPLGANYAANLLGIGDDVKTFGQTAEIFNFTVWNNQTGYDVVTGAGGGSPGRYFSGAALGEAYSSIGSRHQMNYGFAQYLKALGGDLTKATPIDTPPLYTHETITKVASYLSDIRIVENNWVSMSTAAYAGVLLSAPGETAASAAKFLLDEWHWPSDLAAVAGGAIEGIARVGAYANPAYAIGTLLAGFAAGKVVGGSPPALPGFPPPEAGYTRTIYEDPNGPFVGAVYKSSDRTILRYADGSMRIYDYNSGVTIIRPDRTVVFRNVDGDGVLEIGKTGVQVEIAAEDRIDVLPGSVVRIISPRTDGKTVIRDYADFIVTTNVGTFVDTSSGSMFSATEPATTGLNLGGSDSIFADATYNDFYSISIATAVSLAELVAANPDLSADMSIAPGTKVKLPTNNTFNLNINPDPAVRHQVKSVDQGGVASGGGWEITTDASKLNSYQFIDGTIDNTAAAAFTRLLANDFRPGNQNLADAALDLSLIDQIDANPDIAAAPALARFLGSSLNNADALAQTTVPTDPLLFDLNGDGVKLTDYASAPVLFDIDHDGGSLEQTGWISEGDGIAVMDINNNGKIDDMGEALSEYFNGATGINGSAGEKKYANGFAALKSLDSNSDDVFTNTDAAWNKVKMWVDANHDGKSFADTNNNGVHDAGEASELKTFTELGITQINLANTAQSGEVRGGNEVLARGTFVQGGHAREALAANFLANPNGQTFTQHGDGITATGDSGDSAYVSQSTGGESIDVAVKGVRNAYGSTGADTLNGDAKNNWLAGGQGSDVFDAGAGDDVLLIDADDLQPNIHGGAGMDIAQVVGDAGVTLNLANAEIEIAQGGRGRDVLIGGGRSSVFIRAGAGDDIVIGGAASDAVSGEDGDDMIDGAAGNDVIRGHRGRDELLGKC